MDNSLLIGLALNFPGVVVVVVESLPGKLSAGTEFVRTLTFLAGPSAKARTFHFSRLFCGPNRRRPSSLPGGKATTPLPPEMGVLFFFSAGSVPLRPKEKPFCFGSKGKFNLHSKYI